MPEVRELFERVRPYVPFMRGVRATYLLDIAGAGNWYITVDDGAIKVDQSTHDADCVIQCSAEDFVEIVEGRRNMYTAFLQGRVRVSGDAALAQRFSNVLRHSLAQA